MKTISTILLLFLSFSLFAKDNNTPVSFTLGDRDRLMRNEQKIDALRNEMNIKFESVNQRFDSMEKEMNTKLDAVNGRIDAVNGRIDGLRDQIGFLTTLIIFVLGGLMSLIGFVIYDRRTAIKPVQREQAELAEELIKLKKENSVFREAMNKAGML